MSAAPSTRDIISSVGSANGFTLKDFQIQALENFSEKFDGFVVAPTGSGKSLCYQLIPALLLAMDPTSAGTVLVISPLVWLMEDQIDTLNKRGTPATRLSTWNGIESSSFLFARPEDLTWTAINKLQALWQVKLLRCLVVDEAHCSLQWGDTFRQAYSQLKRKLGIFQGVPKMALTATASVTTVQRIISYLGLSPDTRVVFQPQGSPHIFLSVFPKSQRLAIVRSLFNELESRGEKSPKTVVFLRNRNAVADLWQFFRFYLATSGLVQMYMSTTPERVKREVACDFKEAKSKTRLLIATSAFGLGVDCRGITRVVHLDPPRAIDDYVQQIGRAGRDGLLAVAMLVAGTQSDCDKDVKDYMSLSSSDCRQKFLASLYVRNGSLPLHPCDPCCDLCKGK